MNKIRIIFAAILCLQVFANSSNAQFEPHPELNWFTIETEHFNVVYHEGTERTAKITAKIAEEIYGPITSLYGFEPENKTNFVINDVSDVANGATDYINGRIEIFSSALDYDLRGTHNWLRNVLTHEFTHVIQLQASKKLNKNIPAIYLQWLNYEKERRPDVLYGYPNVIVSYPIASIAVPAWFAEGTAQYQRQAMGYDYWDAQRDMILRMYVLNDNMLTYNEMGQFSSVTSLKAESIYNSGYALVRYISKVYGENKLKEICSHLGDLTNFSMDKAFRNSINKDGIELYNEWKTYLKKDYSERIQGVKQTLISGNLIDTTGFANYYPTFSPDGKKIAFISNNNFDYALTLLNIYDLETKQVKSHPVAAGNNLAWSPDGKKIIFSQRNRPEHLNGSSVFDIYIYDIETEKEKQITFNKRAISPDWSKDNSKITYLINKDGTMNLVVADIENKNPQVLTNFKMGEQIYNPRFSPDGKKIIFDYSFEESRKIAIIDIELGLFEFVLNQKDTDDRNPVFIEGGNEIIFSSNRTGIFNLYTYNLSSKETKQITNVLGGAFMPSVDKNNNIVYSEYTSTGFKISFLKNYKQFSDKEIINYVKAPVLVEKYSDGNNLPNEPQNKFNWDKLKNFDDSKMTEYKSKNYTTIFNQLSVFPVLRIDNYTKDNNVLDMIKPGIYFFSDELISKVSIFGGAFVNRKFERDIYLNFTYNNGMPVFNEFFSKSLNFFPKFVFDGFNVTRKSEGKVIAGIDTLNVGVGYNLFAADLGMEFNLFSKEHNFKLAFSWQKYNSDIDPFLIPSSGISVRGSKEDYFKSWGLYFTYKFEEYARTKNTDINPIGTKINFRYDYEVSDINPQYTVNNDGTLNTQYARNKLHKIDADITKSFGLFTNHSISLKARGAVIFGPEVDNFYDFYASGLTGMKGYPFYSMGGSKVATLNMTYRFPLFSHIDTRISPLYFDKLYMSFYGDIGNAWYSGTKLSHFKKDAGVELRLQAFSFYAFPTSIFLNASYGFDQFTKNFIGQDVTYGKEWRIYFGVLFGYDI